MAKCPLPLTWVDMLGRVLIHSLDGFLAGAFSLMKKIAHYPYLTKLVFVAAVITIGRANHLLQYPAQSSNMSASGRSLYTRLISRKKRDEDPASVLGKGVAFYLGEHCESVCNQILFHVWCNLTSHRCECLPEYPVNVDNKYCVKAVRIDDQCEFTESCKYMNSNSECGENGVCKCSVGYYAKYGDSKDVECVAYDYPFHIRIGTTTFDFLNNMEFITYFSLTLSFVLIVILFYLVIKLINKNHQMAKSEHTTCDYLPPPPPVMLNEPQYYPSLESSPHSYRNLSLSEKDKFHFNGAMPLSNFGSRRQSLSSQQSQSSIKSYSSMRSQSSCRNYRSNTSHCLRKVEYRKCSTPFDMYNNQSYHMPNHLPNSSHMRTKCSNSRCGTGSKIKSEVCLVHNSHQLQEELFVPAN